MEVPFKAEIEEKTQRKAFCATKPGSITWKLDTVQRLRLG